MRIIGRSNDKQCLIRYVEAGMGLFLGSCNALQDESEQNLVALNVVDFLQTQSIFVYHRKSDEAGVALNAFLAFLKSNLQIL